MFQTIVSRIAWFFALWLLQVLVFNHVHIFGYATPMPYVYFLLILPVSTPRWAYVLSGFVLGLLIDIFANTPGMAACALTLTGLFTPWLVNVFRPSDDDETFAASRKTMEWSGFTKLIVAAVSLHCIAFFLLETFSFVDFHEILIQIVSSSLLTSLFCVALELIRVK